MIVEKLDPAMEAAWDAYVESHPQSTCYHLRAWGEVGRRAYGLQTPFLIAREGDRVRGVLPLFVVGNRLRRYLTTGLFGAYGVILAADDEARQALIDRAREETTRHRARFLLHKSVGQEPLDPRFWRRDLCVIATLPLAPDAEAQWRALRAKTRNQIRQAQRAGLEVRVGPEHIGGYYDVLSENMHRKGTPIYGYHFMRELAAALGERAEIVTVWSGEEMVAAALVATHRDTVLVPFASSRPDSLPLRPNHLLYWEIIRRSCGRGMKVLDFGRSPRGSGALAFKLGWGAQVTPQPFLIYAVRGAPPSLDTDDRKVRWLARLWQRLPRRLAEQLGPPVCARFLA